MTIDSVVLALQHFPLGVGFGRFGSATAQEHYSIEYLKLGYDSIQGLGSPGNPHNHGRWLTDTQWPAIIGETGLVGAAVFIGGLWAIFTTFRKAARVPELPVRLLGVTGMGWSVHILLQSVAYPVFTIAPTSPLLFGLGAITYVVLTGSGAEPAGGELTAPADSAGGGVVGPRLDRPGPGAGPGHPARHGRATRQGVSRPDRDQREATPRTSAATAARRVPRSSGTPHRPRLPG
jgi:hypothetical protein